ncbi:hypothetical protein A3Q56_02727, partial [Intoshia linei]
CSGIAANLLLSANFCEKCDGYYYSSACIQCVTNTVLTSSDAACERCAGGIGNYNLRGYPVATGKCQSVSCSSTTSTECGSCNGYWPNGIACTATSCSLVASTIIVEAECNGCENRIWIFGACTETTDCSTATAINTAAFATDCGHAWQTACDTVDCNNLASLTTPLLCGACHNRKFVVGTGCLVIDCLTDALTTQEACYGCRRLGVHWSGTCVVADCSTVVSGSTVDLCNACEGYWYDSGACNGNGLADCTGTASQQLCNACWAIADAGTADTCDSIIAAECPRCHHMYVNAQSTCVVHTRNTIPDTKEICDQTMEYKWDGTNCVAMASDDCTKNLFLSFLSSQEMCTGCMDTTWTAGGGTGFCLDLDCTASPDIAEAQAYCDRCAAKKKNRFWNTNTCDVVSCATLAGLVSGACLSCPAAQHDGNDCVAIDCAKHPMDTSTRCNACTTASSPLYWANGTPTCITCMENCLVCGTNGCTSCKLDYYWDPTTWSCKACSSGLPTTAPECNNCVSKVFEASLCKDCPINCVSCSSTTSCDQCTDGKVWSNGACVDCYYKEKSICEACSSVAESRYFKNTMCYTCYSTMVFLSSDECDRCGLFVNGNSRAKFWKSDSDGCLDCPTACLGCSSTTTCDICPAAMYFNDVSFACENCIAYCDSCSSLKDCSDCGDGRFFVSTPATCSDCPNGCKTCSSGTLCSTCYSSKYWDANALICQLCINNCATCETASPCTLCDPGYYLNVVAGVTTCSLCSSNCQICTDDKTCLTCNANFCINSANECLATSQFCSTCDADSGAITHSCKTCIDYHKLELCVVCPLNCLICSDATMCTLCDSSFYLISGTCSACSLHCLECTSATTCSKCIDRYYFDSTTTLCAACPANCDKCSAKETCDTCLTSSYYFDDVSKSCAMCMGNCLKCSDGVSCSLCKDATFYDTKGKTCSSCPGYCNRCINSKSCTECMDGTMWEETTVTCKKCGENCEKCLDLITCLKCDDQSYLDTTVTPVICTKCSTKIPNCEECFLYANVVYCTDCYNDYIVQDDRLACINCQSNCLKCVDPRAFCEECDASNYLSVDKEICSAGRCFFCASNEKSCTDLFSASNFTMGGCEGLGVTGSCWITSTKKTEEIGDGFYNRTCKQDPCLIDAQNMMCKTSNTTGETICERCCVEDGCNFGSISSALTIMSRLYAISIIATIVVLII